MGETTTSLVRKDRVSAELGGPDYRIGWRWLDRQFTRIAVLPTAIVMLAIFGLPLLFSLYLSLQGWSIDQSLFGGRFAGLANYDDLLTDPDFIGSLLLTLGYTLATVAAEMGLGLGIALLLNVDLPLIGFFRTALVVPMMMTPIVAAFCWKLLLDPDHGVIDYWIGQHIVWLGQPGTARLSVSVVNVWQNAPYVAILLLAGLRSLPHEPMEAASIDGAGRLQAFWHVTLPLLQPYMLVALLLRTIFEFRAFDNVYVLTSGGPADATMLLSMFTYMASFVRFDLSLGAAASWLMLVISLLLCLLFIAVIRRRGTGA
ncbi:MAG TPA: sugar ABC transporter permease [Acetobacteraceae bacterium]|nr:sugar ABC transporter permease [Acetobacteraceae bacterium]